MNQANVKKGFWFDRLAVNATGAILHQWQQLEGSGCIENFRIAAGEAEGFRVGWFFADSDAYKWLEAAVRTADSHPDPQLLALIDDFTGLIERAQTSDGYLFTYNQIHFPTVRWKNLLIEHELYCHGHLIEAGVSHFQVTGRDRLLNVARRAADRILADFHGRGGDYTPGHEEIELALLRLHEAAPGDGSYLELARQFIEQRGRTRLFALSVLRQNASVGRREKQVRQRKQAYFAAHPNCTRFSLPPGNAAKKPPGATLRWYLSALRGAYFQQHAPIRKQTVPVGHSVRFAYLETAAAMLARIAGDRTLLPALEQAWERMVTRRMYVTGGIGSAPGLEGFGCDDELEPEYAYAETCAALGSLFWNWEMSRLTGDARYSDLFEWQLYNAAAVGMGLDGTTYFYNNPLACHGGVERRPWYAIPCCPSNISRTWADLGRYIFSTESGALHVHQYIGSELSAAVIELPGGEPVKLGLEMQSDLPWEGKLRLTLKQVAPSGAPFELRLRLPSWAGSMTAAVNGHRVIDHAAPCSPARQATASGFDPRPARFLPLRRPWSAGDTLEIEFEMPVRLRRAHAKVRGHQGKVAISRGPLVYCLESNDNPGVDIFSTRLAPASLAAVFDPDLLGGFVKLAAKTTSDEPLVLIPYFLWGNRGPSQMTTWIHR